MTVAWIAARTEPQLFKTLRAGPWKIKTYDPEEFMYGHVLMSSDTDVIVVDVIDRALLDLCHEICHQQIAPVLAIVVDLAYAQAALEAGAHDFMVAPADPIEILLRLQKLTRIANIVRVGDLEIDLAEWSVSSQGHRFGLLRIEFRLLAALAQRVGQPVHLATILEDMQTPESEPITIAQLKSYMGRLQKKIEPDPQNPQYIISIPGGSYRLRNQRQWEARRLETGNASRMLYVSS